MSGLAAGARTGAVGAAAGDGGAGIVGKAGSVRGARLVVAALAAAALVKVAVVGFVAGFGITTSAGRFDAATEGGGRVGAAMVVVAGAGATGATGGVFETTRTGIGFVAALVRPISA